MARRLFGARKRGDLAGSADWPQLPGAFLSAKDESGPISLPPPPPASAIAGVPAAPVAPEEELLERITAFRGIVADSLYETSRDYQMLCNLTHADLSACEEIIAELRGRLAGNIHYEVLAKLDEAHALASAHAGGKE